MLGSLVGSAELILHPLDPVPSPPGRSPRRGDSGSPAMTRQPRAARGRSSIMTSYLLLASWAFNRDPRHGAMHGGNE